MTLSWPEDADVRRIVAQWGHLLDEALISDGGEVPDLDWPDDLVIAEALASWGAAADLAVDAMATLDPSLPDPNLAWLAGLGEVELTGPVDTLAACCDLAYGPPGNGSAMVAGAGDDALWGAMPKVDLDRVNSKFSPVASTINHVASKFDLDPVGSEFNPFDPVASEFDSVEPAGAAHHSRPVDRPGQTPATRPALAGWTRKHKVARPGLPILTTGWSVRVPTLEPAALSGGGALHLRSGGRGRHGGDGRHPSDGRAAFRSTRLAGPVGAASAQGPVGRTAGATPDGGGQLVELDGADSTKHAHRHGATAHRHGAAAHGHGAAAHRWATTGLVAAAAAVVLLASNLLAKPHGSGQALRVGGGSSPASAGTAVSVPGPSAATPGPAGPAGASSPVVGVGQTGSQAPGGNWFSYAPGGSPSGTSGGGASATAGANSAVGSTPGSSVATATGPTTSPTTASAARPPTAAVCPTPTPGSTAGSVVPGPSTGATTTTTIPTNGQSSPVATPVAAKGHSNHRGTTTTVPATAAGGCSN